MSEWKEQSALIAVTRRESRTKNFICIEKCKMSSAHFYIYSYG